MKGYLGLRRFVLAAAAFALLSRAVVIAKDPAPRHHAERDEHSAKTDSNRHAAPKDDAEDAVIRRGALEVRFGAKSHGLSVLDRESGVLLEQGTIRARVDGAKVSSADTTIPCRAVAVADRGELILEIGGTLKATVRLTADDMLALTAEGTLDGPATFTADATGLPEARQAILLDDQPEDRRVLTTVLGRATVPGARSLFDPRQDLAITARAEGGTRWERAGAWRLTSRAASGKRLLGLKVYRHYYRDALGIQYYRPMTRRADWPTAPIVAMTWYGICGVKQPQSLEALRPEIDWVAKNLLPYAGKLVFQLDDNYPFADDRAMRALSDYIRSKGLTPGVWFTPFSTVPPNQADAIFQQHPDWFLCDAAGKPIAGFAGRNWGGPISRGRSYLVNVSQPEAVEKLYKPFWRTASETWNYDFFKIDGQPSAAQGYRAAANGGGIEAYRRGLEIGREVVGPRKFINGCSGSQSLVDWIGMVDGSRTGGDTGYKGHAIDVVLRRNFLNNVCWWCDPDAAATLFDKPVEVARLNAQARALTGQQFLTDDYWTKVPEATMRAWQRSFPSLDVRPVNLYPIENGWEEYDLVDLRIAEPQARDVVGLFNYSQDAVSKTLDLGRLPLESDRVHVFEFWSQTYLGRFSRDAKIPRYLKPLEGQVFSVVPADGDRPELISTSRHVSQGGLELSGVQRASNGQRWTIRGTSSRLVEGDPYELVFAAGSYRLTGAQGSGGTIRSQQEGNLARVTILPDPAGKASWEVAFEPREDTGLVVRPATLDLEAGRTASLQVAGFGPGAVAWNVAKVPPGIRVNVAEGRLDSASPEQTVILTADAQGRPSGQDWTGQLMIEAGGRAQTVNIHVHVAPPRNLAQDAKASASSNWSGSYGASQINDGRHNTRWNSGKKDAKGGAWVELVWPEPVVVHEVVIDEDDYFGLRTQTWRLEAGAETLATVARGETLGRKFAVKLPQPVRTQRLRLTIDKSSQTPTIWEIEVK